MHTTTLPFFITMQKFYAVSQTLLKAYLLFLNNNMRLKIVNFPVAKHKKGDDQSKQELSAHGR